MEQQARPARGGRARLRRERPEAEPVVRITSAAESLQADLDRRSRRYLIQMSIRVVCFLGAVAIDHWSRWLLLVGAVVLPYVAVVLANAGREPGTDPGTYLGPTEIPAAPPPIPESRAPGGRA